jgi:4-hydroxy-tetrahydrodipicolinate synthase
MDFEGKVMQDLNYPVWTALVTPFLADGSIDFESLEALIIEQEKAGNALLILGSTGEALALNLTEKKSIIRFLNKLKLKVPVMIGVGGFQLEEQMAWMQFCQEEAVIQAFLLVTPMYAKPGLIGQARWFEALLNTAKVPCMLYNVPGRAAVKLIPEVLTHLKHHERLWSLKEASGSLEDFKAFQQAYPEIVMYSGDDALVKEHVALGAKGVVSVAANAWPGATARYVKQCLQDRDPKFSGWSSASDALFLSSNPIPVKILSHHKGLIRTAYLRPPLTSADLSEEHLKILLQQDQAVTAWFTGTE